MDVCPDMPKRARRDEVLTWIAHHPNVSRYAIIDDEDDELDELPLMRASGIVRLGQNIHSLFKRDKS